jgi:glycine/D-amino acid oxidase-like deaminating enzyme
VPRIDQPALCDQKVGLDYYRLSADRRCCLAAPVTIPVAIRRTLPPTCAEMLKVFPQLADVRIDYQWGGKIGITANRFPQVGRLKQQPNVFYAQGYSGHGLNVTAWCARLLGGPFTPPQSGHGRVQRVPHMTFPGGPALRSPLLALGMFWYRLRGILG